MKKEEKKKERTYFTVKGTFKEKGLDKTFSKTVFAFNESRAKEKTYGFLGSHQGINRRNIKINEIQQVVGEINDRKKS
ncbi:MAG: 50S ribosomal protein L18Ae [archaeon]